MDEATLFNALGGLFAYDTGSTDSGIHDEALRDRVKTYLDSLDERAFRLSISKYVREHYLTDAALAEGYGIEDVKAFTEWLADSMRIYL